MIWRKIQYTWQVDVFIEMAKFILIEPRLRITAHRAVTLGHASERSDVSKHSHAGNRPEQSRALFRLYIFATLYEGYRLPLKAARTNERHSLRGRKHSRSITCHCERRFVLHARRDVDVDDASTVSRRGWWKNETERLRCAISICVASLIRHLVRKSDGQ